MNVAATQACAALYLLCTRRQSDDAGSLTGRYEIELLMLYLPVLSRVAYGNHSPRGGDRMAVPIV